MSEQHKTPHSSQCEILGELWVTYKNDEDFEDFVEYNDIGLPFAYLISYGIVESTELAEKFVSETWDMFMASLGIEDTGFDSLQDIFGVAGITDEPHTEQK